MITPSKTMKWSSSSQKNKLLLQVFFACFLQIAIAQPGTGVVVDQVAGIVGNAVVLRSEIESQYQQYTQQGNYGGNDLRCRIFDQLLLNKLLVNQANIDSLVVTDDQINQKIDNNLAYYIQQLGSVEKLEAFYGKSVIEVKEEFKPLVKDQLLAQQMQGKVTKSVSASPADVKAFYEHVPKDSLPLVNAEVEYSMIIHNVAVSEEQKNKAKEQLTEIRNRILKGEEFSTLAILYSQDKESAKQGGELGFVNRGDLVPSFEAVAFHLKNKTELSEIVETQFGFHIMQLIERRGEKINVRHILIKPETNTEDVLKAQTLMDSIAVAIRGGTLKFADAAERYSDDTDTKMNAGNAVNSSNGSSKFETDQVDATILFQLDKMSLGEISNPMSVSTKDGKQAYQIIMLKSRTSPHRLNLTDDYQKLQEATLNEKQQKAVDGWRNKKKLLTYIKIADEYKNCDSLKDWITQ